MWKTYLWKTWDKNFIHTACGKTSILPQPGCGEKVLGALGQNGLFHINFY
jgi:hypothetical protein